MYRRVFGASALLLSALGGPVWAQSVKPNVVVPPSSVVRAADAGHRAHTNVRYLKLDPRAAPPSLHGAQANLPPFPGLFFETPASLACLYALVPKTLACNPQQVTQNANGGSKAIAIVDAFDDPTVLADLQTYSAQFGLPATPPLSLSALSTQLSSVFVPTGAYLVTAKVVLTNRSDPPDAILREVWQRSGGRRFERIEDVISAEELQAISDRYKKVAGFDRETLKARPSFV